MCIRDSVYGEFPSFAEFIAVWSANVVFPTPKSPNTEKIPCKVSRELKYLFNSKIGNFM